MIVVMVMVMMMREYKSSQPLRYVEDVRSRLEDYDYCHGGGDDDDKKISKATNYTGCLTLRRM